MIPRALKLCKSAFTSARGSLARAISASMESSPSMYEAT
jgi:hypothetical protein